MLNVDKIEADIQSLMNETMRIQAEPWWMSFAYAFATVLTGLVIVRLLH